MIDKAPILAIPPKAFGDKHFSTEFNKFRMFMLGLADGVNDNILIYEDGQEASDYKQFASENSVNRYRETTRWYDGTPMTDARIDNDIFIKRSGKYLQKTISSDTYLKIPNIAKLRLQNGYYEGQEVSLLGYNTSGDKAPLTYKFTVANFSSLVDDGGSIIKTDRGSWIAQFNGRCDARDYGCSDLLADNSDILNKIILNTSINEIIVDGLNLKFLNPIFINRKIKLRGIVRSTIFDFSLLTAGEYAFRIASSAAINGLEIEGLRVIGNSSANCFRFNQTGNINFSVTDSIFQNLRIESFNTGLQSNYIWCNTFLNVRFNGCIEPVVLNAQSNQLDFIRCSFVSFKKAIKHTNCEGITYSTCNIANFNLNGDADATQSFMSLSQSNVTIINPYFEYVSAGVLSVGASSEVNKSSLSILGGKTTDDNVRVKVNGNDTKISLKGLNNKNGKDIYTLENASNDISPTNYLREIYVDNKQYNKDNTIAKFDGNERWSFGTFGGGASNLVTVNKGFKTIQFNGSVNTGFRMTNSLVSGEWYTLAYIVNSRSATGAFRIHHGTNYQVLNIQNLGDNYEMRFVPFKAMDTNLDFACTVAGDTFDIRYLILVKGNYLPDFFDKTYIPHSNGVPTSLGDFVNGDIVKDSTLGDTYYTLVSGVWQTVKLMKQSASVTDVTAASSTAITLPDLATITTADATDLPTAITLLNEIKSKYNTLAVPLINDTKSKYNVGSTLSNANKTQINAKLAADRASGQQS